MKPATGPVGPGGRIAALRADAARLSAMSDIITLAAEAASEGTSAWPFIVGGGILLVLFALMAGLLMFGKGREHS